MGTKVILPLVNALSLPYSASQTESIRALAILSSDARIREVLKDTKAISRLVKLVTSNDNADVKRNALWALTTLAIEGTLSPLIDSPDEAREEIGSLGLVKTLIPLLATQNLQEASAWCCERLSVDRKTFAMTPSRLLPRVPEGERRHRRTSEPRLFQERGQQGPRNQGPDYPGNRRCGTPNPLTIPERTRQTISEVIESKQNEIQDDRN